MISYLRCPYCTTGRVIYGNKIPHTLGLYKVKCLYNNVLVLQCQRCKKTFRTAMLGSILLWGDMSIEERNAFNEDQKKKKEVK